MNQSRIFLSLLFLFVGASQLCANFSFSVEIEGVTGAVFQSVEGLSSEVEVIESSDGNDLILRKRPGRTKYGNITLKRGYARNTELENWVSTIRERDLDAREIVIVLKDASGEEVRRWTLIGCWPSRWKLDGFEGSGGSAIVEEFSFVVEAIEVS